MILHPRRPDLPILLGATGPRNVELAGEIADGWLPNYFTPRRDQEYRRLLQTGMDRAGRTLGDDFIVAAVMAVRVTDDIEGAVLAEQRRLAFAIGGMGAVGANFHARAVADMGYEDAVRAVETAWREGDQDSAIALVPRTLVEEISLIGPPARIRESLDRLRETVVTTVIARPSTVDELHRIAEAFLE
jgi:alkanesulfonate monooxygenase SsuD/methylene tetrahydromethanopterin reductase-like flavin-dependent oxidoreductase (luciferase family)